MKAGFSIRQTESNISGEFLTEYLPIGFSELPQTLQFIIEHRCEAFEDVGARDILDTILRIAQLVYDMQESEALRG